VYLTYRVDCSYIGAFMAKPKGPKAAKPDTPKKARKDLMLRIRVTQEQKETFEAASERAGLTVSSWIVTRCLERARHEDK